jgi:hypothetical protein
MYEPHSLHHSGGESSYVHNRVSRVVIWNFTQTVLTVLFTGVLCGTEILAGLFLTFHSPYFCCDVVESVHVYGSMKILPSIFLHYEGR